MLTSTCIWTFSYPFSSVLFSYLSICGSKKYPINNWFCICVLISLKHKRLTFRMAHRWNIYRTRRKLFCCRLYWLHPPHSPSAISLAFLPLSLFSSLRVAHKACRQERGGGVEPKQTTGKKVCASSNMLPIQVGNIGGSLVLRLFRYSRSL